MLRLSLIALLLTSSVLAAPKTREEKVREDKQKVEAEGFWIYNDLQKGFAEAKRTGKPLLVVLRCVPCEECVKLDDDLVDKDPVIRPLLDKFVCVRVVGTNGLDLSLFQYDTDQSFAVFMLNADRTIYGRFGTRSHRTEWFGDVSLKGLAQALQGALKIHADSPNNKDALAGKIGPAPEFPSPEKYPVLKEKYGPELNYSGNVVQSCIHCHQIGDAQREYYRALKQPMPEKVLFPYPHPKSVGLILDPDQKATVKEVTPDSPASAAGFRAGDVIQRLAGQPLLSIADVQWVLQQVDPQGGSINADVLREGQPATVALKLEAGWRRAGDISWRASSWGLRRMATGGIVLESMTADERSEAGASGEGMALRVKHVGQFGAHAAAKQAGVQKGDVVIEFDGRADLLTEADVLRHAVTARVVGDRVPVTVLRDSKKVKLTLPMQQ
ncbi:Trx7/PDZ domain-containing (seleno)protein [Planctellipticum variicoloris]|uniref:Trx7/PDZ domain-containing (seleno)protein n=1 Tax=Planctellipticum variicoloris TaxID=3064265 RepID=UPI0030139BCA|nr:PDZ domain-containing protein [Planctomycetaceae bacterium SH412]